MRIRKATQLVRRTFRAMLAMLFGFCSPEAAAEWASSATSNLSVERLDLGLIREFEGFSDEVYVDAAGYVTAAWGTRGLRRECGPPLGAPGTPISFEVEEQRFLCEVALHLQELLADLTPLAIDILRAPGAEPCVLALVSFHYNVGPENFYGSSVRRALNEGDVRGAADALLWWNKIRIVHPDGSETLVALRGLTRRREVERELLLVCATNWI